MPHPLDKVVEHIRTVAASQVRSDGELLHSFVTSDDQRAFAALVKRHGPLVFAVCKRVLGVEDAEDAFQGTFVVLARNAAKLPRRCSLSTWLHGVAYRIALNARRLLARRRRHERQAKTMAATNPALNAAWREVLGLLDEEIQRLPEQYREPFILCSLEGQSYAAAARRMGLKETTVRGRLIEARKRLQKRLSKRGVELTAVLGAVAVAPSAMTAQVAPALVAKAVSAATGAAVPASVSVLVKGLTASLAIKKAKVGVVLFLVFSGLVGTARMWAVQQGGQEKAPGAQAARQEAVVKAEPAVAKDLYGDPLPPGAVARIGTVRFVPDNAHVGGLGLTMAYTPDGKYLACRTDEAITFLDCSTGKEMRRLEVKGRKFYDFVFSPDGKILATLGSQNPTVTNEVCLWDVASLKELRRITDTIIRTPNSSSGMGPIAFTPDGKSFAATRATGVIHSWDVASWHEKPALAVGEHYFYHFSADGKTLISANHEGIRWWDVNTAKEIRRLDKIKNQPLRPPGVSPDGKRLAVLGKTNELHLLNAATGDVTGRVAVKATNELRFYFSPDSQSLAYGAGTFLTSENFETVFIAADTGRELRRWGKGAMWYYMAYSPDGATVAQTLGNVITIRDAKTGQTAVDIPRLPGSVMSVSFAQDNKSLSACTRNGQVASWDPRTGKQLTPFQAPPKDVGEPRIIFRYATTFSADGRVAALVDAKGILYVWEPATGKTLCRIEGQSTKGGYAVLSPDGKVLAVDDKDHGLGLWSVTSGNLIRSLPIKYSWNRVFSADARVLATSTLSGDDDDKKITLWDTATGKEIRKLKESGMPAWSLAISPDCKFLVSIHKAANDQAPRDEEFLRIWDLATGRELRSFPAPVGSHFGDLPVISPDGKTLATGAYDVNLWDLTTGKERARFTGHRSLVLSLAFSHDGRLLASGSDDHTALIWDQTGMSPDGKLALRDVDSQELKRLWSDLGSADAAKAYRTMWLMVSAQRQSVPFLAERLRPVPAVSRERIARLIRDLESEQFNVRTQASKELRELGDLAEPALSKALAGAPSLELRQRVTQVLDGLYAKPLSPEQIHVLRALEVLEHVGRPDARQVLQKLANGAPGARETVEATASLERLAQRVGKIP